MMPLSSSFNRISLRNMTSPLTRRRTSMESQKTLPAMAENAIYSGRSSQARRRFLKLAALWITIVFLAVKFFSHTASKKASAYVDDEGGFDVPYTMQRPSYVRPAAEWLADRMYDAKSNVNHHIKTSKIIPSSLRKGLGRSTTRRGPPPHEPLVFPSFQAQMYKLTAPDWKTYEAKLVRFAREAFPKRLAAWSASETRHLPRKRKFAAMPSRIWQTGRVLPKDARSFIDNNPKASYNFFTDPLLERWATEHFNQSQIKETWDGMERVVLKTDFWRYLVMYLEGGFYSDIDTDCLKPVDHWGQVDVVKWDLGPELTPQAVLDAPPQIVVGIEVDVPDVTGWETFWPRPIQIVQWTMAGAPGHPIYLDAVRRVVESMARVHEWDEERKSEARRILAQVAGDDAALPTGRQRKQRFQKKNVLERVEKLLSVDPFDREGGGVMSLIEATGPGAFSDAVFSYLQARFGIHWSQLHNIQTATRIGDVAILPITGFAPFQRPDWQRWKGIDRGPMAVVGDVTHPQAMVYHHFSGSWRKQSDVNV